MTVTPKQLFEEKIPTVLKQSPERIQGLGIFIQFNITGPGGGSWSVNTLSTPPTCEEGTRADAQCTITLEDSALSELLNTPSGGRPSVVMRFIVEGSIEMDGDVAQAMKISRIFSAVDDTNG